MSDPLTNLNDYVEVVMGQAPPGDECNKDGKGTVFVKAGEFQARTPVAREWTTKPLKMAQSNDSLVCVVGATAGKVNLASFDCAIGRSVAAVRPKNNKIHPLFLYQFLQTRVEQLRDRSQGAAQGVITREMLLGLTLAVPPLGEQRRIAAILDQAETLRTQRRIALALLDNLTQSLFLDMFGDPVANPKGWPVKPVSSLGKVVTGNTPSRDVPAYYGNSVEWIKSDNLNTPHYYVTKATEGLSEAGKAVGRLVPPNSILVTCIAGSPDCIGNAAMADREVAFNQQINAFIPVELDAHFAYAQIVVGKKLIQGASTNGMKGMVSKSRFEAIEFMVPPLPLQQTFATRIASIEALKASHRHALAALDALFASLQQRAFSGELTLAAPRSPAQSLEQLQQLEASIGLEALIFIAKRMPDGDLYNSLKAIYFADRHHLEHHGHQIYNETYSALDHGPVPQAAYDATKVLIGKLMFSSFDDDAVRAALRRNGGTLTALRDADFSKLSRIVIESLEWGIRYCRDMKFGQTKTASHDSAYERTPKNEAIPLQYIIDTLPPEARQRHWNL